MKDMFFLLLSSVASLRGRRYAAKKFKREKQREKRRKIYLFNKIKYDKMGGKRRLTACFHEDSKNSPQRTALIP